MKKKKKIIKKLSVKQHKYCRIYSYRSTVMSKKERKEDTESRFPEEEK